MYLQLPVTFETERYLYFQKTKTCATSEKIKSD